MGPRYVDDLGYAIEGDPYIYNPDDWEPVPVEELEDEDEDYE